MICSISGDQEFLVAATRLMTARAVRGIPGAISARYIRKNTEQSYQQYIRTLDLFFAGMKLQSITIEDFAVYQRLRLNGHEPFIRYRRPQDAKPKEIHGVLIPAKGKTPCPAKPKKVNQELGFLKHLMSRANCWTGEMDEMYEALLDDEEEIPRALTPDEQRLWLDTARLKPEWAKVYYYSIMGMGTCMSTDEIRGLRLGDMDLRQRIVIVRRQTAKNKHRARTIELVGADVLWAAERLIELAGECGSKDFQHYLFPRRDRKGPYDPNQPMSESGIKTPWNAVRKLSGITWFRQYDLRHTAITRKAEEGVPADIIMSFAGHVSERMRRHYTHISQAAQRRWLERSAQIHYREPEKFTPKSQGFQMQAARRMY